jgi:hypothetical protein
MELTGVGLSIYVLFQYFSLCLCFFLWQKILEWIRCYKLVLILIGYVVNTLVNQGKMLRGKRSMVVVEKE